MGKRHNKNKNSNNNKLVTQQPKSDVKQPKKSTDSQALNLRISTPTALQCHHTGEMIVTSEFIPKQGKHEDLLAIFKPLIEETRKEPGCLVFDCTNEQGTDNFIFFEKYRSEEDLEKHLRSAHYLKAYPEVQKRICGESVSTRMHQMGRI